MKTLLFIFLASLHVAAFQARVTSYTGAEDPINGDTSCSGARLRHGQVAADLRYYPLGTRLSIDGAEYTVADCGSAIIGRNHFDMYCSDREEMNARGTTFSQVQVLSRPSFASKRTEEHARISQRKKSYVYSSKCGLISIS